MPMSFTPIAEATSAAVDAAGVAIIVIGLLRALVRFASRATSGDVRYRRFRQDLGRGILLGLEFLVAADIIRTVAVAPTLENVLVLGLIVLIRTFLSIALQVEIDGVLPWARGPVAPAADTDAPAPP